jgi:hypothetical protein
LKSSATDNGSRSSGPASNTPGGPPISASIPGTAANPSATACATANARLRRNHPPRSGGQGNDRGRLALLQFQPRSRRPRFHRAQPARPGPRPVVFRGRSKLRPRPAHGGLAALGQTVPRGVARPPGDHDSRRPRHRPGQPLGRRRDRGGFQHRRLRRIFLSARLREHGPPGPDIAPARPLRPAQRRPGISCYYTSLTLGAVDFAILEDRKFKSGPKGKIPEHGPTARSHP